MATPLTRRIAVLLAGVLLYVALVGAAISAESGAVAAPPRMQLRALGPSVPLRAGGLAQAGLTYRGGPIATSSGETVDVRVSETLPVETSTPEGWAEFLAKLTHGPELARLTTYIVSPEEVQEICGSRAAGCYGENQMVAPGEPLEDISPEEIVRHEYGHHIALHRSNAPWTAIDWGPKRWASTANVCSKASRGEAFPGDEGSNYARNPGEAWAETYRLMDERKVGITAATWPIVSRTFFPTEVMLRAAEQDVLSPWNTPRARTSTRLFGKRTAKVWWIPLSTALDGDLRISATMPTGGTHEVALVSGDRRTVVKRAQWVGQRVKRLSSSICGQRSLFVRVTQAGAFGRVRVSVSTP